MVNIEKNIFSVGKFSAVQHFDFGAKRLKNKSILFGAMKKTSWQPQFSNEKKCILFNVKI